MRQFIYLLFFMNIWNVNLKVVFFDIPGEDDQLMLADFNHQEHYQKEIESEMHDRTTGFIKSDLSKIPIPKSIVNTIESCLKDKYPTILIIATKDIFNFKDIKCKGEVEVEPNGFIVVRGASEKITFATKFIVRNPEFTIKLKDEKGLEKLEDCYIHIEGTISETSYETDIRFVTEKDWSQTVFTIKNYDAKKIDTVTNFNIIKFVADFDSDLGSQSFAGVMDGVKPLKTLNWGAYFKGFGYFNIRSGYYQLVLVARNDSDSINSFGGAGATTRVVLTNAKGGLKSTLVAVFSDTDDPKGVFENILVSKNRDQSFVDRIKKKKWCLLLAKVETNIQIIESLREEYTEAFTICYPTAILTKSLPVKAGASLHYEDDLDGDSEKCYKEAQITTTEETSIAELNPDGSKKAKTVAMQGLFTSTGISWNYDNKGSIDVKKFLKCKTGKSELFELSGVLFESTAYVTDVYKTANAISITIRLVPEEKKIFEKQFPKFELNWADVTYDRITDTQTFAITMEIKIGESLKINSYCNSEKPFNSFSCQISIPGTNLKNSLKEISPAAHTIVDILDKKFTSIFKSGFKNLMIEFTTENSLKTNIQCQFVLGNYEDLYMELLIVKDVGHAVGFSIQNFDFEALVQKLLEDTTLDIKIPWLTRLEMNFVYSKINEDRLRKADKTERKGILKALKQKRKKSAKQTKNWGSRTIQANTTKDGKQKSNTGNTNDETENDKKKYTFSLPPLIGLSIYEGTRFELEWKTPREILLCKGDSICEFLCNNIADVASTISFNYAVESFSAKGSISGIINLTTEKTLTLESLSLEIGGGKKLEDKFIQLEAQLLYYYKDDDEPFRFSGMFKASLAGTLQLQFAMKKMIKEPFGISSFAMGDFYLGAQLKFGKKFTAKIEIGVRIKIGNIYQEDAVKYGEEVLEITGYVGVDPVAWAQSWIYAKMNSLTFEKIGKILDVKIPENLWKCGFTDGLIFSYSLDEQKIVASGKTVPAGIHIAGKVKMPWFEASADILLDLKKYKYINCNIEMSPINWFGGLISVSRVNDTTVGPIFRFIANSSDLTATSCYIDGQITMFGMTNGMKIIINENAISMTVVGTIAAGLFQSTVSFDASMPNNDKKWGYFKVTLGITSSSAFEKITKFMILILETVKNETNELNASVDDLLTAVTTANNKADIEIQNWNSAVEKWKGALKEKKKNTLNKRKKNEDLEKDLKKCKKSCKDVCLGLPTWILHCWKAWGFWVPCSGWNKCAETIPDLMCFASCELKLLKNAFLEWIEETIIKIEITLTKVASGLITMINGLNNAVGSLAKKAEEFNEFVSGSINDIIDFAIDALQFEIKKLELKAEMEEHFRFCFSFEMEVVINETTHTWNDEENNAKICLDQILLFIAKTILGKDSRLIQFLNFDAMQDEFNGKKIAVVEAQKDLTETKRITKHEVEQKVDLETSNKVLKENFRKDHLPNENIFKFINQMKIKYYNKFSAEELEYLNRPTRMKVYSVKRAHIMKPFKESSPWVISQKNFDSKPDYTSTMTSDDNAVKKSLIFESSLKPCERMKRALHSYATVTNGLMQTVNSMTSVKLHTKIQRRNDINNLAQLYGKTYNLGIEYSNYLPRQKRDIYYWYDNLRKGYDTHDKITKRTLRYHQRSTLPVIKHRLNEMLKRGLNSSFEQYTTELQQHAMEGYKRTNIPTMNEENGEDILHSINRNLTSIITNEGVPLTHMKKRLNDVNAAIRSMNKQTMQCQD